MELNQPKIGMNLSNNPSNSKDTTYTLLVNGIISGSTTGIVSIQNEHSNLLCSKFKGFKVVGVQPVNSLSLTFYFLTNPETKESEIGIIYDQHNQDTKDRQTPCKDCNNPLIEDVPLELTVQKERCSYYPFVNANCLGFSIDHPIKSWVKVDDCNIRLYFVQGNQPPRYIDYEDYQKITLLNCPKIESNELDCDKIKIFKDACYPIISYLDVVSGGSNTAGVYQFAVAYADAYSNPLTNYFYVSNPIDIWDKSKTILLDGNTAYPVSKSIKLRIDNINPEFDWFNLVVLKTVNTTTTPYLVETFSNTGDSLEYIYSGLDKNLIKDLSIDQILRRTPVYDKATGISESNGYSFIYDLEEPRILNLQPVINKLQFKWKTVELNEGDYANPIIAEKYKSFLRDEVVPVSIEFSRTNTAKTARFHIPGRPPKAYDLQSVAKLNGEDNPDVFLDSSCNTDKPHLRWQVYNTATNEGYSCGYNPSGNTNTIEAFATCNPDVLFYKGADGIYYEHWDEDTNTLSTVITNPCERYSCATPSQECKDSIFAQYQNTTDPVFDSCSISLLECLGTRTTNVYNPSGNTIAPNPSGNTVMEPCNDGSPTSPYSNGTGCINASCFNFSQINNCEIPLYVSFTPTTRTWYTFIPYASAYQFNIGSNYNITEGNSFKLTLYSTTSGYCADAVIAETQIQASPYFIFGKTVPLIPGATYFITVEVEDDTIPVTEGYNDYYSICSFTPQPINQITEELPCKMTISCNYKVTYTVTETLCNALIYQQGDFAYWESTERYPCNTELWGDLADTPIRHPKFPDCLISPHYRNENPSTVNPEGIYKTKNKIYPIGFSIDVEQIKTLLLEAELLGLITSEERLSICGYRILRANRRGNESVIAKGLLYDVWSYVDNVYKTGQEILYPNYPYNPRLPDYFNRTSKIKSVTNLRDDDGYIFNAIEHPYKNNDYINNRYTFHSANTHFNNPGLGTEVKLEMESYGMSEGRFNEVTDHAKYQYVGVGMFQAAWGFACAETALEVTTTIATTTEKVGVLGTIVGVEWILIIVASNLAAPGLLFSHYYEWLELLTKFAPYRNYAWMFTSIGNYVNTSFTNIDNGITGNRRRGLKSAEYIIPGILTVNTAKANQKLNNFKRESSVFLSLNKIGSEVSLQSNFLPTSIVDDSRWCPGDVVNGGAEGCVNSENNPNVGYVYRPISSYYASIKNNLPSQYGQIDQIDYVDTGYNGVIDWNTTQSTSCSPIFGGDTFINRLSVRTQMPFFIQDRVGYPPNTDVLYNELGNIGYPEFFFNYPPSTDIDNAGTAVYGNIAIKGDNNVDYNFSCESYTGESLFQAGVAVGITSAVGAGIALALGVGITYGVVKTIIENNSDGHAVFIKGKFFLYSYGAPSFIGESDYNVDLRYGENFKEKDFIPHVSDIVSWAQPKGQSFNLIDYDNTYFYNRDYSKPNKENLGFTLNPNFEQEKEDCKVLHPNRVIYSLQDNDNNDRFDGNLVFLANNYYDFPKSAGKLKIVKGVDSQKVLVIQEDQASIFNSYISTENQTISQSTVGTNSLFNKSIPTQYVKTDLGFGGSQTSAITTTEFGTFWIDNKRGQVLQLQQGINDIVSEEDAWWFKEFLPFKILKDFPQVDIDNNYKHFGMAITYDSRYKRVIFTKRDSQLLPQYKNKVTFDGENFHYEDLIIFPTNPVYFCNQSWTISYSPVEKRFISFHTYTPNFYSQHQNYFSGGWNYSPVDGQTTLGLWDFNLTSKSYQVFNNKLAPFILEYPVSTLPQNKLLDSISYSADFLRYTEELSFYKVNNVTYNKSLIYSSNQTTGTLELIPGAANNIFQSSQYPKTVGNTTQIIVKNTENFYKFNNLKDISTNSQQPIVTYECGLPFKTLNTESISYKPSYLSTKLLGDYFNVRLENDKYSNYNIIHYFNIAKTTNSL